MNLFHMGGLIGRWVDRHKDDNRWYVFTVRRIRLRVIYRYSLRWLTNDLVVDT